MFNGEDFITAKGVILSREPSGESNLWIRLFLKDVGMIGLSSKNFKGDSEPFVWGIFNLQKKKNSSKYFVYDIEVKDTMLCLRRSRETLVTAFDWIKLLFKYLPYEHPDNELLTNLYWSMKLLAQHSMPFYIPDWRFVWKWLELWGLAPDIVNLLTENKFNDDEIILLTEITILNFKGVINLLSQPINKNIRENSFKIASGLARKFLIQV